MKDVAWLREAARDIVALGSLPFFILVLVRVWMLNKPEYFMQFVVAGVLFGALFIWLRQNVYAGLGLIILIFTSLYYEDYWYAVFGSLAYVLLLGGLIYLREDWKKIGLGLGIGIFVIGISLLLKI